MEIKDSVVLVTGGNRGLGKALVDAFLTAGARKVYVGSRTPIQTSDARLVPIQLDITNPQEVAAAAERCADVTILMNNAGIAPFGTFLTAPSMDNARQAMETNYLGTLAMVRAFASHLKSNGGGVVVNMLSVLSWFSTPVAGAYSASKYAELALTESLRIELHSQGTQVIAVHAGYIDTDMTAGFDAPKTSPEDVAAKIIEGISKDQTEVLADQSSHQIKATLANNAEKFYQGLQADWNKTQQQA